jgi:hypothetical protein
MLTSEQIEVIIKENWLTKSNAEIGILCGGLTNGTIRTRAAKFGLPKKGTSFKAQLSNLGGKFKEHKALKENCEEVGIPIEDIKHYWYKGKHFSVFAKGKEIGYEEIKSEIISQVKEHAPKYPNIYYPLIVDSHLLVIDPADIHIGKLCSAFETNDEYNHEIAITRVKEGVTGILHKAQPFNIDKILFIIGNDILHVDNAKSTTTSGTHQDSNLMWYDAFKIALKLYVEVIEMMITVAPVEVHYNPSNHDYVNGFLLAQTVEAWFNNCKNITFNSSIAHRKYYSYGSNLIGTTHGDGAKETDLALLMAHESTEWQMCKHRYFYTHHIHHKKSKDYMSVCVEALRSPSGTDSWHSRQGFQHAPKAVEAFIHHPLYGQIARITHLF